MSVSAESQSKPGAEQLVVQPAASARLRGAVFGCGMISEFHLRAWSRIENVDIVALGDQALERAEARRIEFVRSARVYDNLEDLLQSEQLDFLDVATPPAVHKGHCLQALSRRLRVICQKPIADNVSGARSLVDAFDDAGCSLAIHENHRYRPWFQEILRRAREGFFGKIRFVRFEQLDSGEPPETYKLCSERGILLEYGTHVLDMLYALLGVPDRIGGTAHRLNMRVSGESFVHLTAEYPETTACIDLAWKSSGLPYGNVVVIGEQGEAYFEGTMTRGEQSRFRLVQGQTLVVEQWRSPFDDYCDSFYWFQRDVVRSWLTGTPVPHSGQENLKILEAAFAAYRALEGGSPVKLGVASADARAPRSA